MEHETDRELVREHLANERTCLAWSRTGIGVMAFGFAVVKFSLFVKQIASGLGSEIHIPQKGYSSVIGILLVVVGCLISLFSFLQYRRNIRLIRQRQFQYSSSLIAALTAVIITVAIMLVAYLADAA